MVDWGGMAKTRFPTDVRISLTIVPYRWKAFVRDVIVYIGVPLYLILRPLAHEYRKADKYYNEVLDPLLVKTLLTVIAVVFGISALLVIGFFIWVKFLPPEL